MTRIVTFTAVSLALLAGCDGTNPFVAEDTTTTTTTSDTPVIDDTGGEVATAGIPTDLAGNLQSIAYDPTAGTLSVDMAALDRNDVELDLEAYNRNTNLETPAMTAENYQVYSYQDDGLDRMYVAIVAESPDGSVQGAVIMDGGQFTRFFGGGFYATDGSYTAGVPTNATGLVSYAGLYSGLSNIDADGAELIPVPAGTPVSLLPSQPGQVQGDIFFNADFGDNSINGAIYNRSWVNLAPALVGDPDYALNDVYLLPADITTAGAFFGDAIAFDSGGTEVSVGSYGGTFGGTEAPGAAGTTHLTDYLENVENEEEFGVFVLTQCGQPGEAAICGTIPVSP